MGGSLSQCMKSSATEKCKQPENTSSIPNGIGHHRPEDDRTKTEEQSQKNAQREETIKNSEQKQENTHEAHSPETEARMEQILKQPLERYYRMDHRQRGLCLIFNHEKFLNKYVQRRRGTKIDRDQLLKTFTALNFDVRIFNDCSERKIRRILHAVSKMDHSHSDCLVVIILSHGESIPYTDSKSKKYINTILSIDLVSYVRSKDTLYPMQMIWSYFTDKNCPTLANKPKIFLVQACQGDETDPGIKIQFDRSNNVTVSPGQNEKVASDAGAVQFKPFKISGQMLPQNHFLIAYASFTGFVSFRSESKGTWFIQTLCKMLDEREDDQDLLQILTVTSQQVAYEKESRCDEKELDGKKQIPCVLSMLDKLLIFPKTQNANGY